MEQIKGNAKDRDLLNLHFPLPRHHREIPAQKAKEEKKEGRDFLIACRAVIISTGFILNEAVLKRKEL